MNGKRMGGNFAGCLLGAALLLAMPGAGAAVGVAAADAQPHERPLHRFLSVQLSPDGTRVASVEGDSGESGAIPPIRELVIRQLRDGAATHVALPCGTVPQCWPGSPAWSPDGKRLTFTLRTPGSHHYAVYGVAADGSALAQLVALDGTIDDLRYGPSGQLAMLATAAARKEHGATEAGAPVSGDLDQPTPEQRIAILAEGTLHWASPPGMFVYEYAWLPDGSGFVGTAAQGDGDDNWWVAKLYAFQAADGAARLLYAQRDARQQLAAPIVSRDGRHVVFIAGIMSDFGSTGGDVYTLPLAGGPAINLTPGMTASATSLAWSCTGRLLVQRLAGSNSEIIELGMGGSPQPPKPLWSGEESLSHWDHGVPFACPSGVSAMVRQSFTLAPEIGTGPLGRWQPLTSVNAGMSAPLRARSLAWRNEGFDVQGWLLLPSGPPPAGRDTYALVTEVHGGPAAAETPAFVGPGITRTLLEHGYAVFLPNPRGSFGQGERFAAANVRDFGYGDLRDVLAGIDAVERLAPIDETRLGITGGSYGGFMTMWAVTQTQRFKAAVAHAGISNWLSYYGENGIDEWMLPYFGASAYEDPAVYARSSAINFIRNVRTPTLVQVGEFDIECPAPQSQEFWHALKELGVPTSIMIYPGEGHRLREPEHVADSLRRTLEWFERYLR